MSMSQSLTSQHWSHLPQCEFVQLAMIGSERRRGDREEEMVRLAQQGRIETIMSYKKPINLENLFQVQVPQKQPLVVLPPPPPYPRVLLIEGAPGGGKSALAFHFCNQWAQYASFMDRFEVVVLVHLRDQAIQNATTLADILPARALEMSHKFASRIQDCAGNRVLFIFDGWNEFPSHLQNNSLVSTIIRQPHKLSLHQSTILITSRPVSSGNLLHFADRQVEILGFTQRQIREFIEKALNGNSTYIQKLFTHLEEHPVIEGYCYVPLHVAILVHIFLTMKGALPTTLHELFCDLAVLCSIAIEQETNEPESFVFFSLDDLSDELKSKLSNLSLLAYEGVMQNKVVFYEKDIKLVLLPANLSSLGLLQAVEGLTILSKSLSYNFIHISVQEFLAAYRISQMVSSKQVEEFKKMFNSSRLQPVLHHYCGFTKLANEEIKIFLLDFQDGKSSFEDILPLLHCFFEAQQPSLCQLIKPKFIPNKQELSNARYLTLIDFFVVRYFFTCLLSTSRSPKIQDMIYFIQQKISNFFYDDAMKSLEVSVSMEITSIGTQGYPGVGKTSVLKLALGEELDDKRNSTDCVDPPVHHMMIKHEDSYGVKWERVTTNRMFELVCEAMKKTIHENPPVVTLAEPPADIVPLQTDETEDRISLDTNMADEESSSFRTPAHETFSDSSHKSSPQESFSEPSFDSQVSRRTIFSDLLKQLSFTKASGVIFNSRWMMVTDCGGQPPFLDAAALFVQNSCLVFLPIKLNEPLSNYAEYSYFVNGVCESAPSDAQAPHLRLTYLQTIEKLAKSIASFQLPQLPLATGASERIKFTIVGTFEDKAGKCTSETILEKESILKKALEDYRPFRVDFPDVIMPINAVTKNETEQEESRKNLQQLIDESNVTIKKDVKLCWFGFLLGILNIVEKENKAVLTLDECFKLGDTLGMDKSQTREAIQFFDEIRLIMHFDTPKLGNFVIIDTKVVFKKLSELLRLSFLDETFVRKRLNIRISLDKLRHHGLFTVLELEKYVDFKSCQIEVQFFLDVLEHKKIISDIESTEYYFIPCALYSIPEVDLDKYMQQVHPPVSSVPWVFKFRINTVGPIREIGYIPIPVGYLPTLVIFLLKQDSFSIGQHVQYRNVINIQYNDSYDEGTVYLVERHMQLEVYYSHAKSHPKRFSAIKVFVLKSMQKTQKELRIRDDAFIIFLCSCGKNTGCTYELPNDINGKCCEKGKLSELVTHHSCRLSSGNCMFTCHCMLICIHVRVKTC